MTVKEKVFFCKVDRIVRNSNYEIKESFNSDEIDTIRGYVDCFDDLIIAIKDDYFNYEVALVYIDNLFQLVDKRIIKLSDDIENLKKSAADKNKDEYYKNMNVLQNDIFKLRVYVDKK